MDILIPADGTSCRQQIRDGNGPERRRAPIVVESHELSAGDRDGAGREAVHVARLLADALVDPAPAATAPAKAPRRSER